MKTSCGIDLQAAVEGGETFALGRCDYRLTNP